MRLPVLLITSLFLAACAQPQSAQTPAPPPPANGAATVWLADVEAMAAANDNAGRRAVIEKRLDTLGIAWKSKPFTFEKQAGENLLADIHGPANAPLLLIGAHSDRVEHGRGATDNASGSATVLALGERLKRTPLKNHRVVIAFWDLEERGLLGSRAYIADKGEKPAMYVNFDVFGWGDTLWMMTPRADGPLVASSKSAADAAKLGFSAGDQYPPTDHRAFLAANWPAVSYSLLGASEIAGVLDAYAGKKPKSMPKVMEVIHSDGDVIAQIDANAAARGVDAIEDALRRWDAEAAATTATQ